MSLENKIEGKSEKELLVSAEYFKKTVLNDIEEAKVYWDNLSNQERKYIMQNAEYQSYRKALKRTTRI